jgi:tol-pal system protein YbgF
MRYLPVVLLAVAATGCVSSGDIELLHREITDVSRDVQRLGQQTSGKQDLQSMSRELGEQSDRLLKSNADIQLQLQQLREQIEALQASLEVTVQRLDALSNELAATRERLAPPPPAAGANQAAPSTPGGPSEPAQLYTTAYEDYLRGNFDLALQGFGEYLKRYPDTDLADNALYWVGECHYSKRDFPKAIETFTELLNRYKTSDKAGAALLKKGLAYLEAGDRSQAVINLQYVLYEYPGSKEAELARSKLQSLGIKVK